MNSGETLNPKQKLVLRHIARYGLSFVEVIEHICFRGKSSRKTLASLSHGETAFIERTGGFKGKRKAVILTPAGSRYIAGNPDRSKSPSFAAINLFAFCCLSGQRRIRLEPAEIGQHFGTPLPGRHLVLQASPPYCLHSVYTPGATTKDSTIVDKVESRLGEIIETSDSDWNPDPEQWLSSGRLRVTAIVETEEKAERISNTLSKRLRSTIILPSNFALRLLPSRTALRSYSVKFDPSEIKRRREKQRAAQHVLPAAQKNSPVSKSPLSKWNQLVAKLESENRNSEVPLPSRGSEVSAILNESEELRSHVFVGLNPETGFPRLVPRAVLYDHAYILGATGSGKTSCGMIPLLEQLALPLDEAGVPLDNLAPHPVIIIDLKEVPDAGLKAAADRVAESRGQGSHCQLFSIDERIESFRWNPLAIAKTLSGINQQAGFLLNAFGLVYNPVYGEEYFANAMRTALHKVLETNSLESLTFDCLVELVGELVTAKKSRKSNLFKGTDTVATSWKDARGLYDKIQALRHLEQLVTDTNDHTPGMLDLQQSIEEGKVMYFHLGSTFTPQEAWDVGRLLVFTVVKYATDAVYSDQSFAKERRCFIFMDEFQRMGVKNVVQRFEDARGLGITFVLAHQSPKSLPDKDGNLFDTILQNTAYRQAFTVEDLDLLTRLQRFSGLKSEWRRNENSTTSNQRGVTDSAGHVDGVSYGEGVNSLGLENLRWQVSHSDSTARAVSGQAGSSRSQGISEEKVPRYDDEVNRWVNANFLASVIYVRDGGRGCITPTRAIPRLTRGMFWSEGETRSLAELGFVVKQPQQQPKKSSKPRVKPPAPPTYDARSRDHEMKSLIREAAKKLGDEIPQNRVLETVARSNHAGVEKVLAICGELGIAVSNGKDFVLPYAAVLEIENRLRKDQGP